MRSVVLLLSLLGVTAMGAVRQEWARQLSAGGYASPLAMKIDEANVYVTGVRSESFNSVREPVVIKYDTRGVEHWVRRFEGMGGDTFFTAIAAHGSGRVNVTGYSGDATGYTNVYATLQYSADGMQEWATYYRGPAERSWDFASALVVDESGNVYVTGSSYGINTLNDFATVKYDARGNQLWARRYDNQGRETHDAGNAMAIDRQGFIYAAGYSGGPNGYSDFLTIKYDANGNELWSARYDGPAGYHDEAIAVAVDGQGNVYVAGTSDGGLAGIGFDYAILKYSSAGNLLWTARYNGPANRTEYLNGMVIDGEGNVTVTGRSIGTPDTGSGFDYATVKFAADGAVSWAARFDGEDHGEDEATAIAVDQDGNIYVTGTSRARFQDSNHFVTFKYSPSGQQLWKAMYGLAGTRPGRPARIAVDALTNIYVTGDIQDAAGKWAITTVKYIQTNSPPRADAGATPRVAIAPDGIQMRVMLDASRSTDPDGDPLGFEWFVADGSAPFATNAQTTVVLPLGLHGFQLVVSDGIASDRGTAEVEVITACEATRRIAEMVQSSSIKRQIKLSLLANLDAACRAFDRSRLCKGADDLRAFQKKVRMHVTERPLAEELIGAAQFVIESVCAP